MVGKARCERGLSGARVPLSRKASISCISVSVLRQVTKNAVLIYSHSTRKIVLIIKFSSSKPCCRLIYYESAHARRNKFYNQRSLSFKIVLSECIPVNIIKVLTRRATSGAIFSYGSRREAGNLRRTRPARDLRPGGRTSTVRAVNWHFLTQSDLSLIRRSITAILWIACCGPIGGLSQPKRDEHRCRLTAGFSTHMRILFLPCIAVNLSHVR